MNELSLRKKKDIISDLQSLRCEISHVNNNYQKYLYKLDGLGLDSLESSDEFFNDSMKNELVRICVCKDQINRHFTKIRDFWSEKVNLDDE